MLRKIAVLVLVGIFILTAIPALADTQVDVYEDRELVRSIVFVVGLNEYFVNGETPGIEMDAAPYIEDGRTFVPVRYLGYALGVTEENVKWYGDQNKASLTLPPNTVEMVIGVNQVVTNGKAKPIDVAPAIKPPGRTFLPARYVVEGLGYQVEYEKINGIEYVKVWPEGKPEPVEDFEKVHEYVEENPEELVPDVSSNFPPGAVRVYSTAQLGVKPAVEPDYNKTAVYKAVATVDDLPLPLDGITIYDLQVDQSKWYEYDTGAITVTASSRIDDLHFVTKNGEKRYHQIDTVQSTSDGKVKLIFCAQHLGEKVDGKPLLHLEDVKYFVIDNSVDDRDGETGLLFIENPYQS